MVSTELLPLWEYFVHDGLLISALNSVLITFIGGTDEAKPQNIERKKRDGILAK